MNTILSYKRNLLTCMLICLVSGVYAQKRATEIYDVGKGLPKFVTTPDSAIRLHVLEDDVAIDCHHEIIYHWYTLNKIHQTKAGYSGKLLDGLYESFYPDKELLERGSYTMGVKDGTWIRWYPNGQINTITNWHTGLLSGEQIFYKPDGKKQYTSSYLDNQREGLSYDYKNDSLVVIRKYRKGLLIKTSSKPVTK